MDNGPEMTSATFTEWAEERGIQRLYIAPGKPNQNPFVERFNKNFKDDEVLDANLLHSICAAQTAADEWLIDYNEYRPHESLGDVPPLTYMPEFLNRLPLVLNYPLDQEVYGTTKPNKKALAKHQGFEKIGDNDVA